MEKQFANCTGYADIGSEIVKRWIAILFSVLLVWVQFAPMRVCSAASKGCAKSAVFMAECAKMCGGMACCVAHHDPVSRPVPATPNQSTLQHQLTLLAPAMVAWMMPGKPVNAISSAGALPAMATTTPLYERNCTLLI